MQASTETTNQEKPAPIMPPDPAPLQAQGKDLVAQARAAQVVDEPTFQAAGEILVNAKKLANAIEAAFKPSKSAAHEAHRRITALEASLLAPLKNVEQILKTSIGAWQLLETKKRREAEAKLAEEARKRNEERQLTEAEAAEAAGDHEAADEIVSRHVPTPVVALPVPKASGISARKRWNYRIVDPLKVGRAFLLVDEKKVRAQVTAMGPDANEIVGGIEVYEDVTIAVGGGRGAA